MSGPDTRTAIPHRIVRPVFALGAGLLLAFYAYERATDPEIRAQKEREETAVLAAREILRGHVDADYGLEIVDPLARKRAVGKAYIYPAGSGWEVSGHYRRNRTDEWHPFLIRLDANMALVELAVRDEQLKRKADGRPVVEP